MCLCIAQEANRSSLAKWAEAWGGLRVLVNTEEKENGIFGTNFIKTHTSPCPVLKEQNPVATGEEQYVDNCVPQKHSVRDNSHPPHLTQHVPRERHDPRHQDTCTKAPAPQYFHRGDALLLVSWHSPALLQRCSALCCTEFPI